MTRQEGTYQPTRWSLGDLLSAPCGPALELALTELKTATSALEGLRPVLSPDMDGEAFTGMLDKYEAFQRAERRLGHYGPLWFAEDTRNQAALAFMGRMEKVLAEAHNRVLFLGLWWKDLDDRAARRLLPHSGRMRYHLEQERLFKDHTLSEPEEKIINVKDINGVGALVTLYDMMTSRLVFTLGEEGEKQELNRDELTLHFRDPSPPVRRAAYGELFRVYGREAGVLGQIYLHRVRDWANENIDLRRFRSPIAVRNLGNDIADDVVDTLLEVCAQEAACFQRYFRLKADWLGIGEKGKLRRYDLYAPLGHRSEKRISYGEAVPMVLQSLEAFSPTFAHHARRVLDEGHLDAQIRPGKRGGAFCAGVLPGMTPWVLVNYTGEPRQVATLAHELGHAVHALLAAHHSATTFHAPLPLAETASVFAEMLLTDSLLSQEKDPEVRRELLAGAVDDAYATVLRQAYFVLFERQAHAAVAEGGTPDDLNRLYLSLLARQFGDSVEVSEDFQTEWITIPHIFHTPFYCYAYSFGQLLALSLYGKYRQEGEGFTPKLMTMLAHGGAASPDRILTEAGIDMRDPEFWKSGFRIISGMIDALVPGQDPVKPTDP